METRRGETQITLPHGSHQGTVQITNSRGEVFQCALPVKRLRMFIDESIQGREEEEGETVTAGRVETRIGNPLAWRINLFPDMPYALFEADGQEGLVIAVRGFESHVRPLIWRPDYVRGQEQKTFSFTLPRTIWAVSWKKKQLIYSAVYTVVGPTFPLNVTDTTVTLRPWGAGNVYYHNGHVCWGSARAAEFGADGVTSVANAFYHSVFNDHIPSIRLEEEFAETRNPQGNFSLANLFAQTTKEVEAGKPAIGEIPHSTVGSTTLARVVRQIGGVA